MMTLIALTVIFGSGFALGYKLGYDHVMNDVERIIKKVLSRR